MHSHVHIFHLSSTLMCDLEGPSFRPKKERKNVTETSARCLWRCGSSVKSAPDFPHHLQLIFLGVTLNPASSPKPPRLIPNLRCIPRPEAHSLWHEEQVIDDSGTRCSAPPLPVQVSCHSVTCQLGPAPPRVSAAVAIPGTRFLFLSRLHLKFEKVEQSKRAFCSSALSQPHKGTTTRSQKSVLIFPAPLDPGGSR